MSALAFAAPRMVQGNLLCQIPVQALRQIADPFENSVWGIDSITRAEVTTAIRIGALLAPNWPGGYLRTRQEHIGRVAWLVQCGRPGFDAYPIEVDVGIPGFTNQFLWPIEDGNHRFAASIYRNDPYIAAHVAGEINHAKYLGLMG